MTELKQQIRKINPNKERHSPVTDCPEKVKANEIFHVKITLGNSDGHPATVEHHIRRLSLYYYDR